MLPNPIGDKMANRYVWYAGNTGLFRQLTEILVR